MKKEKNNITRAAITQFLQIREQYQNQVRDLVYVNRSRAARDCGISSLTGINPSAKFDHQGYELPVFTSVLYLAPAKISGFEMCPGRSKECSFACLVFSGRAIMDLTSGKKTILRARILRTWLYHFNRPYFMAWLADEISAARALYTRPGQVYAVRLNGTSDVTWENVEIQGFSSIMAMFPDVQFYDYTKVVNRSLPANYHITFSYTGRNLAAALDYLNKGINLAVVFNLAKGQTLPRTWQGWPVLNGDASDYRPGDQAGHIVGLKFKPVADKIDLENNPFIVTI